MKKKLLSIFIVAISLISISGCKKKNTEQVAQDVITYTAEQYETLLNEKLQLQNELAIYDDSYKSIGTFSKFNLITTGRKGFNRIKDKIVLEDEVVPSALVAVEPIGLEANVSLGNDITIKSGDWTVNAGTSDVSVNLGDVTGNIKVYRYLNDDFDNNRVMQDWLEPYCQKNGLIIGKNKKLYIDEMLAGAEITTTLDLLDSTSQGKELNVPALSIMDDAQIVSWGLDTTSNVPIKLQVSNDNKRTHQYKVGLANISGILIEYEFIYPTANEEVLINSLITNISYKNKNLYLR